ncbi:MAG: hypothetical protein ABSE69_20850 [Roseiarcus sp.]
MSKPACAGVSPRCAGEPLFGARAECSRATGHGAKVGAARRAAPDGAAGQGPPLEAGGWQPAASVWHIGATPANQ